MKSLILFFLPFSLLAQEYAVLENQVTTYTIYDQQSVDIDEEYTLRINSEKGHHFTLYKEFTDKFRKLKEISIEVIDNNGKHVKKLRKIDGHEIGFNDSYEITDGKIFIIDPDYKNYPFKLIVKSKVRIDGYLSLPTWIPQNSFNLTVEHAELNVVRPQSIPLNIREDHIKGEFSSQGSQLKNHYEVSNLAAVGNKIRYKDFYMNLPKVYINPVNFNLDNTMGSTQSWVDFGNWFLNLNSDPYELKTETKEFINSLDKSNKRDVVQKIYEYMQDRTRYISIQLGIGGFKSLPTEKVEKFGYGDCKALSTYTKNMLEYAGIKSNYILVKAGKDVPNIITDFPGHQFNHVFIGIPMPSDTLFLECTSQMSPANHTGTFTDDRNVLWVEKNSSTLIRSKSYGINDNIQTCHTKLAIDKEGSSNIEYSINNKGIFFDELMLYKMAPTYYTDRYNEKYFDFSDFSIKGFSYKQPVRNEASFDVTFKLNVSNIAKRVNDKLIVPTHLINTITKHLETDEMRRYASISRGVTFVHEIIIEIPQNHWIVDLPKPETIESIYGKIESTITTDGTSINIKRKLILNKGDYTNEKYDGFKKFYDQFEKTENRKLVLNSKT